MRRLVILSVLLLAVFGLRAQTGQFPVIMQNTAPTGACTTPNPLRVVTVNPNAGTYQCISGVWTKFSTSTNNGTVTSVALTGGANLFSSTPGAAVTNAGTLNLDTQLLVQAAHCVIAGPVSGTAAPTCRALLASDLPTSIVAAGLRTGVSTNTDLAGRVTASGGTATYTFTGTYITPPVCITQDDTTIASLLTKTVSATTLTVTTSGATDTVSYICAGRN
jgi:hypothetical protein